MTELRLIRGIRKPRRLEYPNPLDLGNLPIPKKRCAHCGRVKPITDFHKKAGASDGHQSWCKECKHDYNDLYKHNDGKVKICPVCNVTKPLSEFAEGYVICKECKDGQSYKGMDEHRAIASRLSDEELLAELRARGIYGNLYKDIVTKQEIKF